MAIDDSGDDLFDSSSGGTVDQGGGTVEGAAGDGGGGGHDAEPLDADTEYDNARESFDSLESELTTAGGGGPPSPSDGGEGPLKPDPDGGLQAETGDPAAFPDESVSEASKEPVGADHPLVKTAELQEQAREHDQTMAQVNASLTQMGLPEQGETTEYVEQQQDPQHVGPAEAAVILGVGGYAALRSRGESGDRDTTEGTEDPGDDDRPRS